MRTLLALSLEEDLGTGDVTTLATVDPQVAASLTIRTREACVVSGLSLFAPLLAELRARCRPEEEARTLKMERSAGDGARLRPGDEACLILGTARALLMIERTLLNLVGRMSGISTTTSQFVEAARAVGAGTRILDTRKTAPGHRVLEKYAVRCGGGSNHRVGLFDFVLIKDNHIAASGGVAEAVFRAKQCAPSGMPVEVECETHEQIEEALSAGADRILLDNFSPDEIAQKVALVNRRARVEISGGVNLDTVAAYAAARPDDISVGALTHSARSIDLTAEIAPVARGRAGA